MSKEIRDYIRPLMPRSAWKLGSRILDVISALLNCGPLDAWRLFKYTNQDTELRAYKLSHPFIYCRKKSHENGIIQNCFRAEYDRHLPPIKGEITIIDAGAFIGDLTTYWASRWPKAQILALEPDDKNHEYAARNLAPYGQQVRLIKGALWNAPTKMSSKGADMRVSVQPSAQDGHIQAWSIPEILDLMKWKKISILKMDIEGAEYAVLDDSCLSWLPLVEMIILEFHDDDRDPEVIQRLKTAGFSHFRFRSLSTFYRVPLG